MLSLCWIRRASPLRRRRWSSELHGAEILVRREWSWPQAEYQD